MQTANTATQRNAGAIAWIAVVLLLATIGAQLRLSACIGACCDDDQPLAQSCCAVVPATEPACSGCCDESVDPAADISHEQDSDGGPDERMHRGGCGSGCCITVAFDIELAPAPAKVETPSHVAIAFGIAPITWRVPDPRPLARRRPFDRGPPRVDRLTAMRACSVLLI